MESRSLPPFVIDSSQPDTVLDALAKAIDQHGPEFGIASVILHTPRMWKQRRDYGIHNEPAREKRLFTDQDGYFHGTNHNLANNLAVSALHGRLVFECGGPGPAETYTMNLMPSRHDPLAPAPTTPQPAITTVDTAISLTSAADFLRELSQRLPRIASAKPVPTPAKNDLFADVLGLLDLVPATPGDRLNRSKGHEGLSYA